jgi:hypothetical protein
MAGNTQLTDAAANAAANAVCALANGGTLKIYNGAQPANANVAVSTQTLLASLPLSAAAFANAVAGVATANAITSATALATSTATWFRVFKSDGVTPVFDGNIGTSGANLNINSTAIQSGATVSVSSFTYTINEAGS